jgi:hypothetical protein
LPGPRWRQAELERVHNEMMEEAEQYVHATGHHPNNNPRFFWYGDYCRVLLFRYIVQQKEEAEAREETNFAEYESVARQKAAVDADLVRMQAKVSGRFLSLFLSS